MRNSGFKVYEMIVVLAILMVLAGLLMPVLRNARLKTFQDLCASNLSQIHQAVLLYEQEQGTLWEGPLSWVPGLRPYLGDTYLACPFAPTRPTKPWAGDTPSQEQAHEYIFYEYYIHATPIPLLPYARDLLECMKRLGDRAPVASCPNHLRHTPPLPNIFIRRSGQVVFVDKQTWLRYGERLHSSIERDLHRIGRRHRSEEDLELPCPKVKHPIFNLP